TQTLLLSLAGTRPELDGTLTALASDLVADAHSAPYSDRVWLQIDYLNCRTVPATHLTGLPDPNSLARLAWLLKQCAPACGLELVNAAVNALLVPPQLNLWN